MKMYTTWIVIHFVGKNALQTDTSHMRSHDILYFIDIGANYLNNDLIKMT